MLVKTNEVYVALLRGINVGGNNIIKMEALRKAFEGMGFDAVASYIQSGNVVFRADKGERATLDKKIEKGLEKVFGYQGKVVIRSMKEMEKVVAGLPKKVDDEDYNNRVAYLVDGFDAKTALAKYVLKDEMEELSFGEGVFYWVYRKDAGAKPSLMKLSADKSYQQMTLRNARTTRKILEMMKEVD